MSAASDTEIANLALTRLGHQMISSLTEGSATADLCNLHYARCRDSLLRAHPWNFAIKRSTLAQETATPNHEYDYQFALPVDCLKVIRTDIEADGFMGTAIYGFPGMSGTANAISPYRIEGRKLVCNETVIKIEYIAQITDVSQFDELFTDCLAQRLAAEMAMKLTDNQSAVKTMWEVYQAKLSEARSIDSQEGTPRDSIDVSPWLVARA